MVAELQVVNYINFKQYLINNNISNNYIKDIKQFILNLPHGNFLIEKILRVLPDRRIVFLATEENNYRKVIIKLFVNKNKYSKNYNLLLKGYKSLQDAFLLTPQILYDNLNEDAQISYIISEYLKPDNKPVSLDQEEIKNQKLLDAVINLHKNYLYQSDLHLDNFIIHKDRVYYLDCDSVIKDNNLFINNQAYKNLALFLAQLDLKFYYAWGFYAEYYLKKIDKYNKYNKYNYKRIAKIAYKLLKNRVNNSVIKSLRNCSSFVKTKDNNYLSFAKRDFYNNEIYSEFIINPKKFIENYTIKTLKKGNTAQVYLVNFKENKVVIKYYLPGDLLNRIKDKIKYIFKNPRCISSWINANLLESVGINTPSPLACVMFTKYGLINDSYFIMAYDAQFKSIADLSKLEYTRDIMQNIYSLLDKFKILRVAHNDFKTVNVGVVAGEVTVLDLDAMKIYKDNIISRMFAKKANIKDLNRWRRCNVDLYVSE